MNYQGRSPDDLPLAAYTTGVAADEPEEEAVPEPVHLSQQEAVAQAMGIEAPAPTQAEAAAPKGESRRPKLSLPRPSLPKPSLPRLPRFGRGRGTVTAESPFNVTAQPAAAAGYAPSAFSMPVAQAPFTRPAPGMPGKAAGSPGTTRGLDLGGLRGLGGLGATLRNPRTAVRDPRVLFGGMIAIGAVLLGASMLGGGGAGGAAPGATASAAPGAGGPAVPGAATIQVTGDFEATFELAQTAGFGRPADGQLAATWDDGAGSSVVLTGTAGSGTRTTSSDLTLAITLVRNGAPVTFTSEAGECTIGMAEKMLNVQGSFVCPEITSNGGRFTVKLQATYRT
jgi:hypothetical protein